MLVIDLTRHAIERFQERVRPSLTLEQVEEELVRLLPLSSVSEERPRWMGPNDQNDDADAYVELSEGVALFCARTPRGVLTALTCITNRGLSDETRRRRNRAKQNTRRFRRQMRINQDGEVSASVKHPELCE